MKDWKYFENMIIEIVCNRCEIGTSIDCKKCKVNGDIGYVKDLIEDMKNDKILIED